MLKILQARPFSYYLRAIDSIPSHILEFLQLIKSSPSGRRLLSADHKHIDPRPAGNRRLMI